jgi:hypothetical protein
VSGMAITDVPIGDVWLLKAVYKCKTVIEGFQIASAEKFGVINTTSEKPPLK